MALKVVLALRLNIHWDEFILLSQIHSFQRGDPIPVFQTLHVHAFGWLTRLPGNEVHAVLAGRLVQLGLLIASLWLLHRVANHLVTPVASLFVVLVVLAMDAVVAQGASFRTDGLALFLILAAVSLCLPVQTRSVPKLAGASVAFALALGVTLKSVFFLPVLVIWAAVPSGRDAHEKLAPIRRAALVTLAVGLTFITVIAIHSATIASTTTAATTAETARDLGGAFLSSSNLFPGARYLLWSVTLNPATWLLVLLGAIVAVRDLSRPPRSSRAWLLLALASALLCLVFYRNAYFYFFAFLMPPVLLLTGRAYEFLATDLRRRRPRSASLLTVATTTAILLQGAFAYTGWLIAGGWGNQARVLDAVHSYFPDPVRYVDRNGMVGSFPKVGPYMTTLNMGRYRARGVPAFADLAEEDRPRLVLANSPVLMECADDSVAAHPYAFLPEDAELLCRNFVQLWGPLFVPGLRLDPAADQVELRVWLSGPYELSDDASINGRTSRAGSVVDLDAGRSYRLTKDAGVELRLRWVPEGPPPAVRPPDGPIYLSY